MKNIRLLAISLMLIFISLNISAQVPDTTLAGQYEAVVNKSGSYKIYKNIQKTKIEQLWKNVNDSLQKEKQIAMESKAQLLKGNEELALLQAEIKSLKEASSPVNKLSNMSSSTLPWALIVLLGAGLAFVIIRSKSAMQEAKNQSERCEELAAEFRDYKIKVAEKERKLARELQDERNLVEELKAR